MRKIGNGTPKNGGKRDDFKIGINERGEEI